MAESQDIQSAVDFLVELVEAVSPYAEWAESHWLTIVLTGEIVGAVLAVKTNRYRRGFCWLLAALATIWLGGTA